MPANAGKPQIPKIIPAKKGDIIFYGYAGLFWKKVTKITNGPYIEYITIPSGTVFQMYKKNGAKACLSLLKPVQTKESKTFVVLDKQGNSTSESYVWYKAIKKFSTKLKVIKLPGKKV